MICKDQDLVPWISNFKIHVLFTIPHFSMPQVRFKDTHQVNKSEMIVNKIELMNVEVI